MGVEFIRYFFCISLNNHRIFSFYFINMFSYMMDFFNVKPSLHSGLNSTELSYDLIFIYNLFDLIIFYSFFATVFKSDLPLILFSYKT